ncbi:MAG: PaaI family thioesterase [Desulfovibrio sp.]|jgi:acyl-CoA thioesterase|nr:PaaI family thioesterase [Desulfovibrio sp.]
MEAELEKIRAYFAADRYAAVSGIVIDFAREDCVQCSMEIGDLHKNAGREVQGGAIFTLADFAFGVHSNFARVSGRGDGRIVGQSCSISYFRQPKGKRLIVRSALLSGGRNVSVYRMSVSDELGNPVAEMVGNGFTRHERNKA